MSNETEVFETLRQELRRGTLILAVLAQLKVERYGYSLTVVQTGIPPALAARLLVEGKIPERGVMMPEALAPDALMENFSKEGLRIYVERREVAEM